MDNANGNTLQVRCSITIVGGKNLNPLYVRTSLNTESLKEMLRHHILRAIPPGTSCEIADIEVSK